MHPPYTQCTRLNLLQKKKKRNQYSTYIFEYRKDLHKGPVQWMHADRVHNNIIYIIISTRFSRDTVNTTARYGPILWDRCVSQIAYIYIIYI